MDLGVEHLNQEKFGDNFTRLYCIGTRDSNQAMCESMEGATT